MFYLDRRGICCALSKPTSRVSTRERTKKLQREALLTLTGEQPLQVPCVDLDATHLI